MPVVDVPAVKAYMGEPITHSDAQITSALKGERSAQKNACRASAFDGDGEPVDDDLAEALCRRVVRNLAMRRVPLGVQTDPMGGATHIGSNDPEVRRLERPYRKIHVG